MATSVEEGRERRGKSVQPPATDDDGNADNESYASAEDESTSELIKAVRKGDVRLVKRLIKSGEKVSARDYRGWTALHHAAKRGNFEIANMLLGKDKSLVNAVADDKSTPLHVAALEVRSEDMCKFLLRHKASASARDEHNMTPLHCILQSDRPNEEVVRTLISKDEPHRFEGRARLVDAKDNRGDASVDLVLRASARLAINVRNEDKMSGDASADEGAACLVVFLLSKSGQPESYFEKLKKQRGTLSLCLRESCRMGYVDLVKKPVKDGGADPFEGDNEGKTALHYAVEGEKEDLACQIIEHLGGVNWRKALAADKLERNFFHVAAFLGKEELCRELLDRHRNLMDTKDRDGKTPIFYAVAGTHDETDVLRHFLYGAPGAHPVFVKDSSQTTLLHVAAGRGNLKMVKELLKQFPSERRTTWVKATDVLGQTALHKAASGGHVEIVEMLLDSGAHPWKERDCDGKTALHFAAEADGEDAVKIARLLLNKCESVKQKTLLLFPPAVHGIGLPNSSPLGKYLKEEKRKIEGPQNSLRVAATLGDIDMTLEFITRGANIALIRDKQWIKYLPIEEQEKVQDVLEQIKTILEQGTDKPAVQDNLGRSPYAIGLAALFLNPFMRSPITVGISGEWGMGKSSVMVQTETILLKTAAQLAFSKSFQDFQENGFPGAGESGLSTTGNVRRIKIANAVEKLGAKSRDGTNIVDSIGMFIKRAKRFTEKLTNQQTFPKLRIVWETLRALWNESAPACRTPENLSLHKFNEFLENNQPKYHPIFKSLAIMDRHDMFDEKKETTSGGQLMPSEEDLLHGSTPAILTVRYNAWHYRNETEAWAGLAVQITKELEATMTVSHKLRTSWIYNWRNRKNQICFGVIFPFILALADGWAETQEK